MSDKLPLITPADPPGDPAKPTVFDALTNLLPEKWRPYAKSVYPFIATIVAVVVVSIVNHTPIDVDVLQTAVIGLVTTLLAFASPNKPYVRPEA